MTAENPYEAPKTTSATTYAQNNELSHLSFAEIKKLYHRSSNVGSIATLLAIASVALIAMFVNAIIYTPVYETITTVQVVFFIMGVFYAIAVVGLYMRTVWGRILGIIVSIISLLSIPIGTIIGIAGLFAFFKAPELFGQNRLKHKALKKEFKLRKLNMKLAKKSK